jgi:hypothetical protein
MQMSKHKKGFVKEWGRGNCWYESSVKGILRNECYTGKWIYGKSRRVQIGAAQIKAPRSDWIIVPGAIPALVTEEQFNAVQTKLDAASKVILNKHSENKPARTIFQRMVRCADCGRVLNFLPRKNKPGVFYCAMRNHSDKFDCKSGKIEESALIETMLAALQQQIVLFDAAQSFRKAKFKAELSTQGAIIVDIQNLKKFIEQSKSTKMDLWENFHAGNILLEKFQNDIARLTQQVAAYESKITELEGALKTLETENGHDNELAERFEKLSGIQALTKEIVREFVSEIKIYSPNRIEIIWNYADAFAAVSSQ